MGLIGKLWHLLVLKVTAASVLAEVERTKVELADEEAKLTRQLLKQLKLQEGDAKLQLRPSSNGFLVPRLEFFVEVTPTQVAKAQLFLDRLTLARQNARSVPGVH